MLTVLALAACRLLAGHPVTGERILLRQPNGAEIIGYIYGDEFYHRIETQDGYTIILNKKTAFIEFAKRINSRLIPSGFIVGRTSLSSLKACGIRKHLSSREIAINRLREETPWVLHEFMPVRRKLTAALSTQVLTGTKKVFVVCVEFQPESSPPNQWASGTYPPANFHNRIFSSDPDAVSMTNFYKAASYNQFWPTGYTYPDWVTLPKTATWYKENSSWRGIIQDAMDEIRNKNPSFDFFPHSNNGTMDVIVIWAGTRESWSDFFWPKMGGVHFNKYGVYVQYYNAVNERQKTGTENTGISTFCHEYGHMTGCPDLYDYSSFHNKPMGLYDIMGSSNYKNNFSGYLKWRNYGWIKPQNIVQGGTFKLDALGLAQAAYPRLYKISIDFPKEYLLLENRNNGSDPNYENNPYRQSGLLITHVDENYPPAACLPNYPFYGVEAIVPSLNPSITLLDHYTLYWSRMAFSADYGYSQIGPTYPDNTTPGEYLVLTSDDDTEHVLFRNTLGHNFRTDIHITGISESGNIMTFTTNQEYRTLTLMTSSGGITIPAPGTYRYNRGRRISVTAVEDEYHVFTGWTGDILPAQSGPKSLIVTMDKDRVMKAGFAKIHRPLQFAGEKILNRSLSQAEYINILSWKANPQNSGIKIAKYRLYEMIKGERLLIKEFQAGTFEFLHRHLLRDKVYSYILVGRTSTGNEGEPASLIIR